MLGLERDKVILSPHRNAWARLFEEEKGRLNKAIGTGVLDIQHVGSTSVPGLKAKPILDIGVAVENFEEAFTLVSHVEGLGYTYRGERGVARRHLFVKGPPENRTHHLHMLEAMSGDWRTLLRFRDQLRIHPATAAAYQTLKEDLATKFGTNRKAYTDGKHDFIQKALREARSQ